MVDQITTAIRRANRRAKLAAEVQAAGDRVIEAAQAWERAVSMSDRMVAGIPLARAVRDLNAAVAKAERA